MTTTKDNTGAASGLSAAPGSECEEFACVWMESIQEWMVLLPNGKVLRGDKPWGGLGSAANEAMELLQRGACAWSVESSNGSYYSYQKDEEFWDQGFFPQNVRSEARDEK